MDFPDFAVASGEEASDPLVLHEGRVVRVDELGASGHLDRLDDDLADVAALGVRVWRYGMPWARTEIEPGVYDWTLWDAALAACERHGLTPVVDLCHFGLPDHYPGVCDPAWVDGFRRYVDAFLARYPAPRWFTPVNEPGITALCSARFGIWNDRRASEDDHLVALGHVVLANLEALARVRADRDGWWIGAEGFGCDVVDPDDEDAAGAAATDRALQWAVWDLHLGVAPAPGAARLHDVIDDAVQSRIAELVPLAPGPDRTVAGHDMYPVSAGARGRRAERPLTVADRVAAYEATAAEWHARYRRPFWVAETSNLGLPVDEGPEWLDALVAGLDRMTGAGLPVRGVCWYSRGDQVDWDSMLASPVGRVTEVGLFDMARNPRPVADAFGTLARTRGRPAPRHAGPRAGERPGLSSRP
jgi:hypothetical protein